MEKRLISIILMVVMISSINKAQRIWDLGVQEGNYLSALISVGNDTSRNHLRQLISDGESLSIPYDVAYNAAWLLSYYHSNTEREFIISNMRNWVEELRLSNATLFEYYYFRYQYIRGYLGDQGALAGMDTVIIYHHDSNYFKLWPIQLLAEAGQYNYFSMIKNRVNEDVIPILGLYGRDSRFRNEVRDTLEAYVRRSTQQKDYSRGIEALAVFDKPYAISILDELFRSSVGKQRREYFNKLGILDFNGQPQRTIWVAPIEPDDTLRNDFFPYAGSVQSNRRSNRYFEPFFIKFAIDRLIVENSTWVKSDIEWFLNDFIPVTYPDSVSSIAMLDTLTSFKTQVANYGWVGNSSFVSELTNYLNNARSALTVGDSLSCASQLFTFQNKVDEEYRDSLDGDTRTINREGWKFLHYHSQYILERLSAITTLSSSYDEGWNMISLPVMLSDQRKVSIYPSANSEAFAYNGTYVKKDTLKNGIGYWLKYPSNTNINYTGLKIDTIHIPLIAGWNMIGTLSKKVLVTDIQMTPEGVVASDFFGYENTYLAVDTLKVGRGYWVNCATSGEIILGIDASYQGSQNYIEPPPAPDAPLQPVLQSPANGAIGQSTTPTLSWNSASGAETYRLQVASDSSFCFVALDQENITALSYQVGPLSYNMKYYWRVKAYNVHGYSYWSSKRNFTTQTAPGAPPTPTLASPSNGAVNVSTSPTLSWNSSSGATSYRLQVSTNSGFSALVFDQASITSTSKQVSALAYSTAYYWRVNASNAGGTSAWSSARSFTTQSAPSGGDPCFPTTSTVSMDELTVIDANGNRQNLFVHNGGRGLHLGHPNYDLPPETPKGAFHARFKSGKYIEIIPPNKSVVKIPIKVKDVVYPITLQWKLKSGNKVQYWLIDQKKNQKRIPLTGPGQNVIDATVDNLIYIEAQASQPCGMN